jgi:hypothetical protein
MPLKSLIMNLLTLGWWGLKELKRVRDAEIENAKAVTSKAEEIAQHYNLKPPRMVHIQSFDTIDPEYQRKIVEISKDPAFRFFLFNVQQDIFELLNNATADKASEIMGMSKGIKYLIQGLNTTIQAYTTKKEPAPNNIDGEQLYV